MMKKHIMSVVRSVIFLTILACSLYFINSYLRPKYTLENSKWPTTSTYHQFYQMKENSVDVLFLGSSVVVNALSPQEVYNSTGIRSYNLGSEQQSILLSYYWLKEALHYQTPKAVVLDTRFLFDIHPQNPINTRESLTRKCIDPMKWSDVKREAVKAICETDPQQSEMSYYLTNLRFHTRWTELSEQDFVPDEYGISEMKGYSPIEEYGRDSYSAFEPGNDTETKMDTQPIMQDYMDRIVDICKENGIRLILISLPGNAMNDWYNNTLVSYAASKEVDYYNFCRKDLYEALGAELPRESTLVHANFWGAEKMSQYIGRMLRDTYGVQPAEDEQYESTRGYYEQLRKDCELAHVKDINEYLEQIKDDRYTVFIISTKDAAGGLTDETRERLADLGLRTELGSRGSYAAVIDPQTGIREEYNESRDVTLTGTIRDRTTYFSIKGSGYYGGSTSSLKVDGTEYSKSRTGLTFVVYDNVRRKVIDCVTFNTAVQSNTAVR